jgi:hypothetical protein
MPPSNKKPAGQRVKGAPPPRPAPFNPSKVKPAGPKNPVVQVLGSSGASFTTGNSRAAMSAMAAKAFGAKPRTGVSGATYTPGKGTRVTPDARPKKAR